jgi:hypothetical protein
VDAVAPDGAITWRASHLGGGRHFDTVD